MKKCVQPKVAETARLVYTMYIPKGVDFMQTQIKNWGNSQGVRLPKQILEAANMEVDEVIDIEVKEGKIILQKTFRHKTLEERAEVFGGELNLDGEYDWGEPIGREVW